MSNQPERPWTEEEKYTLLTEILKKAGVPSAHLVKMIKDFRISPSWGDIPLPQGRSLNSCQLAFYSMCQQQIQPLMNPGSYQPSRHASPASPPGFLEGGPLRKRPLSSSDKPLLAPRAIQPRPPASAASSSRESGTSARLSSSFENPILGEPPRKRGRPSKAETERRRAAAQARGETYPPPRRSGHGRLKRVSSPNRLTGVEQQGTSFSPNTEVKSVETQKPEGHHEPQERASTAMTPSVVERARTISDRDMGPPIRELTRPPDVRQLLPSPQALQLGPRETILPRTGAAQQALEPFLSHGISPAESSRRVQAESTSKAPPQSSVPDPGATSGTTAGK